MTAHAPEITNVGDALEGLVHQFADPWAFLRELVQNAIDAGSAQIDVRIDHDAGRGVMQVEVADTGEGMTREIIDTRLTRLFSSSKEGDYTKIGRFGIGFVSVFALDPELVCVDTGRAGEWWRVVFRRDRSFERIRLDAPVEGTTVRLYKSAGATEVELARQRARETLEYWCKHVRIELRLDDEQISRPMDLDGLCKVEHREEGTTLVMALASAPVALRGYYHGGLTLHEEHDDTLPHVAFKLDSRFLEHTLTRDNVIRDDNFAKAMKIIGEVARGRLITALFETLATEARSPSLGAEDRALLYRCAAAQIAGTQPDPAWLQRAVIPMHGGPPQSPAALRGRTTRLWRARAPSPVVERLLAEGNAVVACAANDAIEGLIHAALGVRPQATASVCTAVPLAPAEAEAWAPLCTALAALLKSSRWKVREVIVGRFDDPESAIRGRTAITQSRVGELTPVAEIDQMASGWLTSGRTLVLSATHPTLVDLRTVARHEPELAAYLALKSFFLHGELSAAVDAELAALAAEARWRRTTG
jgi:hypothetical protein